MQAKLNVPRDDACLLKVPADYALLRRRHKVLVSILEVVGVYKRNAIDTRTARLEVAGTSARWSDVESALESRLAKGMAVVKEKLAILALRAPVLQPKVMGQRPRLAVRIVLADR